MSNLPHTPEEKLLAMVKNTVSSNSRYKHVRTTKPHSEEEARAYGVLNSDIRSLQESAEKFRKAGQP